MSTVHGRRTVLKVATVDVSRHTKTSSLERGADVHDNTGYGVDDKTKNGGLREHKFTCGGDFDNDETTGPGVALRPLVSQTVAVVRQTEGAGVGKPQESFDAVLSKYVQTNPVDGNVSWSAEFEVSGPIDDTDQSA